MLLDEGADLLRVVPNSGLLDYWNIQAEGLIKTSPDNLRVETQSAGGGGKNRGFTRMDADKRKPLPLTLITF